MKRLTFKLSPILLVGDDVDPIDLEFRLTGAILDLNATLDIGSIEAIGTVGRTETEPARPGMKRLTFKLSPILLVGDDVDPIDVEFQLTGAILDLNATLDTATVEAIGSTGRTEAEPARPGTCRIDGHTFYAPHYFRADREVPDICPDHARSEEDAQVQELHRPLFEEVTRLTGLHPLIWHSGGGCMTIVIPLTAPEPGKGWSAPCYMGLEEGQDDDGRWHGSVSFYETNAQTEDGDGVDVVKAWGGNPQHPHRWAALIAAHYRDHVIHAQPS